MATSAIRKFIFKMSVAFNGNRLFDTVANYWHTALNKLGKGAKMLASKFKSLRLWKTVRHGTDVPMLGQIEGKQFAALIRTARSIEAFESATGTSLSFVAKQAFRRIDDIAEAYFPDVTIMRRNAYLMHQRKNLVMRNLLRNNDVIRTADVLEELVRRDAITLGRVNRLSRVASRTKKIVLLGGTIAATAIGVSYLCDKAAKYAANNTGCFVYINDNGNIRKCRAVGCSCPTPKNIGGGSGNGGDSDGDADITGRPCRDEDLWSRMRLRNSECDKTSDSSGHQPYCVHCDWNESDPNSINYVDRESLPENAFVRCEQIDALDALNEMIGGTVDSTWDVVNTVGKQARNIFASSVQTLSWILGAIGCIIIISVIVAVWRFWGSIGGGRGRSNEYNITSPLVATTLPR